MKSVIVLLISSFLLFSCAHIYFTEVQPKEGKQLKEIPKELLGEWKTGEKEVLRLEKTGMTTINFKTDDTITIETPLSDTFQLFMADGIYVFNYKERNSPWEIMVVQVQENGDINLYQNLDPKLYTKDKNLKLLSSTYEVDGTELEFKDLQTGDEYEFVQATFSGKMYSQTLRSIINTDNLVSILKTDGTSYSPSEE